MTYQIEYISGTYVVTKTMHAIPATYNGNGLGYLSSNRGKEPGFGIYRDLTSGETVMFIDLELLGDEIMSMSVVEDGLSAIKRYQNKQKIMAFVAKL